MTAVGQINAGSRITASAIRGVAPLTAYKATGQTVTSSTTLVNDSDLFLTIAANGVYVVQAAILVTGSSGGNFKYTWTIPSGANGNMSSLQENTSSTLVNDGPSAWTATVTGSASQGFWLYGLLVNSSTAGTLQLQWAQNASNGTGTTVGAYSYLTAWQIQ